MDGNFGRPPGAPPAISGTDVVGALIAGILNQAGQQQPQVLLQQLLQVQQHLPLPPLPHNPPAPPQPHPHLQPPPAADPPAPVPPADPPKPAATGSTQLAGKDSGGKSPFDWSDDDLNIFILDLWYGDKMTNQRCAGAKDSKLYRDVVDAVMKWQTDNRKPAHQLKEEQVKNLPTGGLAIPPEPAQ